eukprot:GABV01009481.1.p2 GENE.GABV01009481.1~~GABV01009481.1.p2  ORF type:complete len:113 (+),score=21.40 GABV01009481.1:142-480(+)
MAFVWLFLVICPLGGDGFGSIGRAGIAWWCLRCGLVDFLNVSKPKLASEFGGQCRGRESRGGKDSDFRVKELLPLLVNKGKKLLGVASIVSFVLTAIVVAIPVTKVIPDPSE